MGIVQVGLGRLVSPLQKIIKKNLSSNFKCEGECEMINDDCTRFYIVQVGACSNYKLFTWYYTILRKWIHKLDTLE